MLLYCSFYWGLGPDQCGILGADADTDIRKQEFSNIRYISQYCMFSDIFSENIFADTDICNRPKSVDIGTNQYIGGALLRTTDLRDTLRCYGRNSFYLHIKPCTQCPTALRQPGQS